MSSRRERLSTGRRAPDAPVVLVSLDASADRPLHRQVYDELRDAILAGRLAPDARLPSTRSLADDLGIARNTVTLAFDQLRAEGYIVGQRGGGTRVRCSIPDQLLEVRRVASARKQRASSPTTGARGERLAEGPTAAPRLSTRGSMLVNAGIAIVDQGGTDPVAFRLGVPELDAFPARVWARLTARRWRRGGVYLGDAATAGEPMLREAIATYVTTARGARCTADNVIVVSGTQQALDLTARVLLDPGDFAWMEDPGYHGARASLVAAGARIVPVPVDDQGLDVVVGERMAPTARLAYVTPSHQFPLGIVMSAQRRLALLSWARRANAMIIEDDYDSEFRYAGRPLPCVQGLDAERRSPHESQRVLYVGTFNKTLITGLRLGYLVVPDALVDAMRSARAATERHPSTIAQGVLADFIGEGHFARHLRRVRAIYAERQAVLLAAAEESLNGLVDLAPDPAGLHLVGWLPSRVSDVAATRVAAAHGVEVSPLSHYYLAAPKASPRGALLLGYAGFKNQAIRAGVRRLARALVARV